MSKPRFYSTIFTTKSNELAILGKTIDDIKDKLINFNDVIMQGGTFSGKTSGLIPHDKLTNILSKTDAKEIADTLDSIINKTNMSYKTMNDYLTFLGSRGRGYISDYVKECKNQVYTTEDIIEASKNARATQLAQNEITKQSTLSYKAASIGMKALAMAGNMLIFFAVTKGIELVAKAIDNYVHRLENAKEKLADITADIESVKNQLKETQDRIKQLEELEKNGTLSITDKEDLENLRLQNEELGIRQKYLEEQQRIANRDVIGLDHNNKLLNKYYKS